MPRSVRVAILCSILTGAAEAQTITAASDTRVELFSILFHLGGRAEYASKVPRWAAAVDSHFMRFADHPAARTTRALATQNRVGFFVPMNLAVHLSPLPQLAEVSPFARTTSVHRTWTVFPDSTAGYLDRVRHFATDARVEEFMKAHSALIDSTEARFRRAVLPNIDGPWFNRFWGGVPRSRLTLVPALMNGGASYGIEMTPAEAPGEGFAIIGVRTVDGDGFPTFDTSTVSIALHELNHPYVTPLVRTALADFRGFSDSLMAPVASLMRAQGYGSWDAVLNETLVRAAVIRYELAHGGRARAESSIEAETGRGFIWIRELVRLLDEYEQNRSRYPAVTDFLPNIVKFFRDFASRGRHDGEA